ncbi:Meiotic expression up-regulated protein 10 [Durusdinium trenchii]|uniref:Meiotic expression up-regulated protein 10 n=1 Tax=Durusdinium trenchii TaxID=1381693 RepID=A0ABP0LQC5_9DINO
MGPRHGLLLSFFIACVALPDLPDLPKTYSTLNLMHGTKGWSRTCFGWRLLPPELILTYAGAYLHGVAINESELLSIRHVSRDLVVVDDIKLTDLSLLANLQTVGGNVEIRYNAQLADISGLSNLEVIGGSLNIYFNHRLREISGFTKLTVIGRSLGIHHNDQLENITGFPALVRIGQDFSLRGNKKLLAAPGMPSLRALGGDVEVIFNPLMQTVDDMVGALEMIEGNFLIKDNDNLTTLALLPNITRIAKRFEVSYNERITEVHGPPQLEQLGALTIKSNNALRLVDGFDRLQVLEYWAGGKLIEGTFQVMFNTKLESLSFPHLESVGNLTLLDNDNLTEASFPGLWSVAGEVKVSYHARLRAFSSNASSAAGISFLANYELLEVSMPNLTHVHGKLAISFNSDLEYLDGFDALEKVDENLEIIGNRKLKDISTFKELNFIGKDFLVDNNTALTDLSGLTPKLKVHGNMEIENNDQLFSISGLETLPFVSGYAVLSIKCSGNAVRPPNRASCVNCAAWEMPSEDKASCQLDYVFVVVVGFVYLLTFLLAVNVGMTVRNVMVVDAIIMSSNGRVLLRTTERHYLLRGFWGRSFPLWVDGTGCSFIDQAEQPIQAKAVGDVELELMVRMEQKTYNRRTLSSLPHSEVSVQRTIDSTMGFQKTDGSCMLSCQGFAVVKSPWELLSAGFCMPCIVWALGFSLALFGLIYLGVTTAAEIPLSTLLLSALQSFALGAFLALLLRLLGVLRRRHQQQSRRQQLRELQLLSDLEKASWEGDDDALSRVQKGLAGRGWTQQRFQNHVQQMRCRQSQDAGVSVAYILSREFLELSQNRSGKDDPNFYDLKDAFFLPSDPVAQPPIGGTVLCPRDGRPGCALVDTLERQHRRECTHFLSWAWSYSVSLVQSAMRSWMDQGKLEPSKTFLYMCFFVNNQYRILLDRDGAGSREFSLGEVFEENLQRVGRMVALLDHWDQPQYLSRIWTIFEQYSAVVLEIEVTFILPQASGESLLQQIRKGEEGILSVRESLCNVDAETAGAWCPEDEQHVKRIIEQSIGFEKVNEKVQELMIAWVATMVKDYLGGLVVLGTRRLQRLRARTFLSVAPTDVSHKRLGVGGDRQV